MASDSTPTSDGRTRRSERSREQIVLALLALVGEGVLVPTAQQVAERAGVGMRTVFRHFSDMETLFAAMREEFGERERAFLEEEPPEADFETRARAFTQRRCDFYERMAPYERASEVQRRRSQVLRDDQSEWGRVLRSDLRRWLPELSEQGTSLNDAFLATTSFAYWESLRRHASAKRTHAAVELTVIALCAQRR